MSPGPGPQRGPVSLDLWIDKRQLSPHMNMHRPKTAQDAIIEHITGQRAPAPHPPSTSTPGQSGGEGGGQPPDGGPDGQPSVPATAFGPGPFGPRPPGEWGPPPEFPDVEPEPEASAPPAPHLPGPRHQSERTKVRELPDDELPPGWRRDGVLARVIQDVRERLRTEQYDAVLVSGINVRIQTLERRLEQYRLRPDLYPVGADSSPVEDYFILLVGPRPEDAEALMEAAVSAFISDDATCSFLFESLVPPPFAAALDRHRYYRGMLSTAALEWPHFIAAARHEAQIPAASTGLADLDEALQGGLRGVTVLGGPQLAGLTSLAAHIAVAALRADPGRSCLYCSIGQPRPQLLGRVGTVASGRPMTEWQYDEAPSDGTTPSPRMVDEVLHRMRIIGRDDLSSSPPLARLGTLADRLRDATGTDRLLVIIDSLTAMEAIVDPDEGRRSSISWVDQVISYFGRSDPTIAVLGTARVARPARDELSIAHLGGAAGSVRTADHILLLSPPPGGAEQGPVVDRTLRLAHTRHGAPVTLSVQLELATGRFREMGKNVSPPPQKVERGPEVPDLDPAHDV